MNVLVVEDDENKRAQLIAVVSRASRVDVLVAQSVRDAVAAIRRGGIDMVVLDMTLPTFRVTEHETGGRVHPYGGREVMRQMVRFDVALPTLVLTAFDTFGEGEAVLTLAQLSEQMHLEFPDMFVGAVSYSGSEENWTRELLDHIASVRQTVERA